MSHETVLLNEAVTSLLNDLSGVYVDGTFGRGGHSRLILSRLHDNARLIGIDKDVLAIKEGERLACEDQRFSIIHGAFDGLQDYLESAGLKKVSGILLDLGVSSPQLDEAERGFSFLNDGPLDMRMDVTRGQTAAEWLAIAKEEEIAKVLKEFGEEKFARRMARAICEEREEASIDTTAHLARVVSEANPAWEKGKHPATRAFQAIRIQINDELSGLQKVLQQAVDALAVGGRLVVISFHSLEDRMVKRFMRDLVKGPYIPKGVPVMHQQVATKFRLVGKAIKPSDEEVERNARARSAVMRTIERVVA